MKNILASKLQSTQPYTNQELAWLLENIGHPDSDIREKLVYATFCHILLNSLITREQAQERKQKHTDKKKTSTRITSTFTGHQAIFPRSVHTNLLIMILSLFIMLF